MKTKYPFIIKGTQFERIDSLTVSTIKKIAGRISQNGIKYLHDDSVVLTSNNIGDILNIVKNGGWAHSINVKRIMPNVTKIFVVPNNSVEKNNTSMGIVFIATTNAIQCQSTGMNWESEKVEDGKK